MMTGKLSEDVHRTKQRKRYKMMLAGLQDLTNILPPVVDSDRQAPKQLLLTSGVQYIHYLQLCIYQLGKDTSSSDDEILKHLHWDIPYCDSCPRLRNLEREIENGSSASQPNCCANRVRGSATPEKSETRKRTCTAPVPRENKMRRSSTSTKADIGHAVARQTNHQKSGEALESCGGYPGSLSPVTSFSRVTNRERADAKDAGLSSKYLALPMKRKGGDQVDSISPSGPLFEIITPPSSYRRTIIQDSPLDNSAVHNWEKVCVRKYSCPWMPKPGSSEEMLSNTISHYIENDTSEKQEDVDVADHFLLNSVAANSFLDSSYSDDEAFPTPVFTNAETDRLLTVTDEAAYKIADSENRRVLEKPEVPLQRRSTGNCEEIPSSTEPNLEFEPGLFLTGRKFEYGQEDANVSPRR